MKCGYIDGGKETGIVEVNRDGNIISESYIVDDPNDVLTYRAERFDIYRHANQFKLEGSAN